MTDTSTDSRFKPGTFAPRPGTGSAWRMLRVHAKTEATLTLRNGEQLLLTLLIPVALLIGLTVLDVIDMAEPRVDSVAPRIFALAVMSSAFTGQAIALGFDRRYGVLKRLAATALPRWLLVSGRVVAALIVVAIQLLVLGAVALALGWSPSLGGLLWALVLVLLGTLSFGALGVLLGGALKAEVVLALANVIWFVLLLAGGILLMPGALPTGLDVLVAALPSGALTEGLHTVLTTGDAPSFAPFLVLAGWGVLAGLLAIRTTKLS